MFERLHILVGHRKVKAAHEPAEHQRDVWLPVNVADITLCQPCHQPHHVPFPGWCIVAHFPQIHEFMEPELVSQIALFRGKCNGEEPLQHFHCGAYCA